LPVDARNLCIQEIQALTGAARGLTSSSEPLFAFSDDGEKEQMKIVETARQDPRMMKLRQDALLALTQAMHFWSTDLEFADVSAVGTYRKPFPNSSKGY